ncbi:Ig-like domain-containing protein, partial [Pseudomonas sp. F1002]
NIVPSEPQKLSVNRVPSSALPRPSINGIANGGVLNLNNFSGNATLSVAPWPLAVAGQKVWVQLSRSGSAPLNVLTNYSLQAGEVSTGLVNKPVLRSWLDGLPNNSTITVTCKVAFDGSSVESAAITFPIASYSIISSLRIDQSQLNLNGIKVITNWPATGLDWPGNTATRTASGGVSNYSYASSNPNVAFVDANTGKVTGLRNGQATITVRDRNNVSRAYAVVVSNIFQLRINETQQSPQAQINWMRSIGGSIVSSWTLLQTRYTPPARSIPYGLCYFDASGRWYYFVQASNSGTPIYSINGLPNWPAWCITPF